MRHINIPVFIPHLGCPHTCVFCNQRKISGVSCVDLDAVCAQIESTLDGIRGREDECECEIAFFGGSFTGIPREELTALLELAPSQSPYFLNFVAGLEFITIKLNKTIPTVV